MLKFLEKKTFFIGLFAFIVIFIGQQAKMVHSNTLLILALGLTIFFSFFCDKKNLMLFMLMLIAPNRILTYGPISAPTLIMIVGILKNIKTFKKLNKSFFINALLLLGFTCVTVFIGIPQIFSAIKIIIVMLFLQKYTDYDDIEVTHFNFAIACSFGCIISTLIALLINPSSINESSRFTFTSNGENVLGILCAILIVNLLVDYFKFKRSKILCFSVIMLLALIGFITGSRSFILALVVGLVSFIVLLLTRIKINQLIKILSFLILLTTMFCCLVKYNDVINSYMNQIIYRITKLQNNDVSNGRYELWSQYIKVFKEHPIYLFFGNLDTSKFGLEMVAHNMIIEQITSFGIIGSIIIIALYNNTFNYIFKKSNSIFKIDENIAPIVSLLGVSFVSHTLLGVPQTIMLYISVILLFNKNKLGNCETISKN